MTRPIPFWRIVSLITLVHVTLLLLVVPWRKNVTFAPETVTWLSGIPAEEGRSESTATVSVDAGTRDGRSEPEPTPAQEEQVVPATNSAIQLPEPTPASTPKPKPKESASPAASPTKKRKLTPRPKTVERKRVAKPAKPEGTAVRAVTTTASSSNIKEGSGQAKSKRGSATHSAAESTTASESNWYGNMLHDRFYREWVQPRTVVASGAKFSAIARIRIDKDGRVSDFKLVRPSGNIVVDESVEQVGKRVTRVDALPPGLTAGDHYDVNINFELNAQN